VSDEEPKDVIAEARASAQEFDAAVARAMAGGPLVMCLVAIGRDGRSHCLTTFPGATSTELYEMIGRLQALVTDLSLATYKVEAEDDLSREPGARAKAAS
jgi:hypothetical protein